MKVSSDILRVYKALHTWVGIGTGLLLFIGFFAGALTMFTSGFTRFMMPATTAQFLPWGCDAQSRDWVNPHTAARSAGA